MNKPVFYIIFLFLFSFKSNAQENLVPNGSFEEYNWCPAGDGDFSVKNWYSPTLGSPDYFNVCNIYPMLGYQVPQNEGGYIGIGISFDVVQGVFREYIQVELISLLQPQKTYYFSCFINKADSSSVCITDIGISFSDNTIGGAYLHGIHYNTQFTNTSEFLTCDESNWNKMEFTFTADGNEKFLTIGFFNEDNELDTSIVNFYPIPIAYYYIDNVILKKVDTEFIIPNVFTPNDDGINDILILINSPENSTFTILNRWGKVVFETSTPNQEFWDGTANNGKVCSEGVYNYLLQSKQGIKKTGFIHLIR